MDLRSDTIKRSDFKYHEQIGVGGCGEVFRVTFENRYKNHTEAAAKSLTHLRIEEIEILRRLKHDNIVILLGFFQDGPTNIIFFEYTPHGSLSQKLAKDSSTPLPNELRRRWSMEAALAIRYLHNKNILHRDIKSSNCLLFNGDQGTLKLCDFGLAKDIDHSQTTSTLQGTYRFMAPEIIKTDDRDHAVFSKATDVWAFGMLVLEICTRQLPFCNKEWMTVIYEVGNGTLFPSIPADCPEELSYIMKRCWRVTPKERPSMSRILTELDKDQMEKWYVESKFTPMDNKAKLKATRIACCPNGNIVVADNYDQRCRYVLNNDGTFKTKLISPYPIDNINSVVVTRQGYIAFTNWETPFVTVFNNEGEYINRFKVWSTEPDQFLTGITANKDGNLLVWQSQQLMITCYSCPAGKFINRVPVNERMKELPLFALNDEDHFIFYDENASSGNDKVVAVDSSRNPLFKISPQISDHKTGNIHTGMNVGLCGLVTGKNGDMFIAMKECTTNIAKYQGKIGLPNTGHLHRYSGTGEFLQCILSELNSPEDLAMTVDGSLVVANKDSILKCSIYFESDAEGGGSRQGPSSNVNHVNHRPTNRVNPHKRICKPQPSN